MAQTSCDGIFVDENIDLAHLRDIARAAGKSFGGNLQLTAVLLLGTEADAQRNALACIDIGDSEGYVLAPAATPHYDTPENVAAAGLMALDVTRAKWHGQPWAARRRTTSPYWRPLRQRAGRDHNSSRSTPDLRALSV